MLRKNCVDWENIEFMIDDWEVSIVVYYCYVNCNYCIVLNIDCE